MDDLISRRAAIDALNEKCLMPVWCKVLVEKMLADLPSASPRWIPVTERMPIIENNIGARVLITTSWGLVKEAYYCVDHWEIDDIPYKLTAVSAWMPLPAPWKGADK